MLLITGDGLKTLDAVAGQIGPTATVPSTSKAVREALAAPRALTGARAAPCGPARRGRRADRRG